MIVIEIVAVVVMLWMLWRALGLWRRVMRGERLDVLGLPIGLHLAVAVLLGFAAFAGDSVLLTDPATTLEALAWLAGIGAVVGGYAWFLRTARRKAADRERGE